RAAGGRAADRAAGTARPAALRWAGTARRRVAAPQVGTGLAGTALLGAALPGIGPVGREDAPVTAAEEHTATPRLCPLGFLGEKNTDIRSIRYVVLVRARSVIE